MRVRRQSQVGDQGRLRELHDSYVWEVNAAIGDGRTDLAWQLADDFLDSALRLVIDGEQAGCDRPDCAICQRPPRVPVRRRRAWVHRIRGRPGR
jgi:hypothetical protein